MVGKILSFILIPPSVVRSIKAAKEETLEYYAITALGGAGTTMS